MWAEQCERNLVEGLAAMNLTMKDAPAAMATRPWLDREVPIGLESANCVIADEIIRKLDDRALRRLGQMLIGAEAPLPDGAPRITTKLHLYAWYVSDELARRGRFA